MANRVEGQQNNPDIANSQEAVERKPLTEKEAWRIFKDAEAQAREVYEAEMEKIRVNTSAEISEQAYFNARQKAEEIATQAGFDLDKLADESEEKYQSFLHEGWEEIKKEGQQASRQALEKFDTETSKARDAYYDSVEAIED